jgi:hypothetical protein
MIEKMLEYMAKRNRRICAIFHHVHDYWLMKRTIEGVSEQKIISTKLQLILNI